MTQLDLLAAVTEDTGKCVSCGRKTAERCSRYYFGTLCDVPLCGGCEHLPGLSANHRKKEA